jgi:OmcA/MtrC family decaheme c-type cytochrome
LSYSPLDKRHYLTDQQIAFIRPGLTLEVKEVLINADRSISVTYKVTDPKGLPLDRDGVFTPGTVSASFILAYIPAGQNQYVAYTTRTTAPSPLTGATAVQASSDSGGTTTKVADGTYKYTLRTKLPEGDDPNATHSIGIYAARDLREYGLDRYAANQVVNFLPSGGQVTKLRDVVTTAACNKCHDPLALHGGPRRAVEVCILCHTPQTIDPDSGETMDMPVLIHKIHRGHNLPSVRAGKPYVIYGNQMSKHDYSHVAFPRDVRSCEACHDPKATQHEAYYLRPNRAACGACHDDVKWASGEGHKGGPQVSDKFCANCHFPEGELEFDASILGAHTIPAKSKQLNGVKVEFVSITNTAPGQKPVVKYRLKDNKGSPLLPTELNRFTLALYGPTTEYKTVIQESAAADSVQAGDAYAYTFKAAIPADAVGTFLVSSDAYRNAVLNPGTTKQMTQRDAAVNPMLYFTVTDAKAVERRKLVTNAKCNACHGDLAFHGGQRRDPQYCVACHNPPAQDTAQRPADKLPSQTIDFKFMIHRIHRGEELSREFTVYGYGKTAHTYNEVLFPGDLRNCEKCHEPGGYTVPSKGVLSTTAVREFYSPIPPNSSACLGCHDTMDAAAHTFLNTAPFGESCGTCHGNSADFSVARAHAR